jgi:hypothetical protein
MAGDSVERGKGIVRASGLANLGGAQVYEWLLTGFGVKKSLE